MATATTTATADRQLDETESPMEAVCRAVGIQDPEAVRLLCGISATRHLKRGERLVEQGEVPQCVAFAVSGVLRSFYVDAKGDEVTDCFADRIDIPCIASPSFEEPSLTTIEALTPCDLVCLDIAALAPLIERNQSIALAYIQLLSDAWRMHRALRTVVGQQDARGRYEWFLENFPGLIDRVPHYYVASFLSITPVTLSRVRTAIRHEEEAAAAAQA